jgi:hypothetical protein
MDHSVASQRVGLSSQPITKCLDHSSDFFPHSKADRVRFRFHLPQLQAMVASVAIALALLAVSLASSCPAPAGRARRKRTKGRRIGRGCCDRRWDGSAFAAPRSRSARRFRPVLLLVGCLLRSPTCRFSFLVSLRSFSILGLLGLGRRLQRVAVNSPRASQSVSTARR